MKKQELDDFIPSCGSQFLLNIQRRTSHVVFKAETSIVQRFTTGISGPWIAHTLWWEQQHSQFTAPTLTSWKSCPDRQFTNKQLLVLACHWTESGWTNAINLLGYLLFHTPGLVGAPATQNLRLDTMFHKPPYYTTCFWHSQHPNWLNKSWKIMKSMNDSGLYYSANAHSITWTRSQHSVTVQKAAALRQMQRRFKVQQSTKYTPGAPATDITGPYLGPHAS